MDHLKKYAVVAALVVVAFSVGRFTSPKVVQTKATEHTTTHQDENINKNQNIVETTKETKLPDGTVIVEIRKEKETSIQTDKQSSIESKKFSVQTTESRPSYRVGVIYQPPIKDFQPENYSLTLENRLFSELYIGAQLGSDKTVGVSLSVGF